MHRPIKTRRLKKADFEADFFFMEFSFHGVGIALRAAPLKTAARYVVAF
jgi:hypothetical protein